MSKKRIFAAVLALGMLTAQSGAFADVLSSQDFTAGEGAISKSNNVNIWGGWVTDTLYNANYGEIKDGKLQLYRSLKTPGTTGTTPNKCIVTKDITGINEGVDDYIVIEFDWYRLRYEVEYVEGSTTSYQIVEDTEPVMLPPIGDIRTEWSCGFGVYGTTEINGADVEVPLFFMSPNAYNYDTADEWKVEERYYISQGTEAVTSTYPVKADGFSRYQMYSTKAPDLTTGKNYRYRLVIELNEDENGKYPYELYLKRDNEEYVHLTKHSRYDGFALTYNEIPTKVRIGSRVKTGYQYNKTTGVLSDAFAYDFDGDGVVSPFCDKTIIDNYLCYTIDTDEEVSKVTYLDVCGNAVDEIVSGEAYTPSVSYNNATESTLPLTVITGVYDADDYFYNSFEDVLTVPTGIGALKGAATAFDVSAGDLVKGFAWNNVDEMVPYAGFDTITATVPAVDEEVTE